MAVHVHIAERTDALADGLASLLATPLADPFAREVVVVPARGVERWLTQRLSHRLGVGPRAGDGVCAGVDFVTPYSLVSMLLDKDADDPWDPERLAWPLLDVIDSVMGEPGFADLTTHLGGGDPDDERSTRRYAVARRLAGLFGSYATQRPILITDWRAGHDTDGTGGELEPDLRWQAELWRRLLARMDTPPPDVRLATTLERLRSGGADLDLPLAPLAVRPYPAARDRGRPARRPRCASRRAPLVAAGLPGALVVARPDCPSGAGAARGRRLRRPRRASPPRFAWVATRVSCGARWATYQPNTPWARRRRLTPCSAGCSPTSAPTPHRTFRPAPAGPGSTTPSRSTPATAPHARSTCCARCWSGCSPTTPRSSRATSW